MAFKLPKNLVSSNNMQNVLYLITLALAVSYIMNRQNVALVSLLLVAGGVYMFKKNVVLALGVSIVVTNLLLSMNYFRQFEGFKEGNRDKPEKCPDNFDWNEKNSLCSKEFEKSEKYTANNPPKDCPAEFEWNIETNTCSKKFKVEV